MGVIYCLYSTMDLRPRYIGQTTKPLSKRLEQHLVKAKSQAQEPLYCWIRAVHGQGFRVQAHEIQQSVPFSDLDRFEHYWMGQFVDLLNATKGASQVLSDSSIAETLQRALRRLLD